MYAARRATAHALLVELVARFACGQVLALLTLCIRAFMFTTSRSRTTVGSTGTYDPFMPDQTDGSHMVAKTSSPGSTALIGQSVPVMKNVIRPRAALAADRQAWLIELEDITVVEPQLHQPFAFDLPSLSEVEERFSDASPDEQLDLWHQACAEYRPLSARLYRVVHASIDFSGPYRDFDIAHVRRSFCDNNAHPPVRDGRGLYKWVMSFENVTKLSCQLTLRQKLYSAKIHPNDTRAAITAKLHEMFVDWTQITGNNPAEASDVDNCADVFTKYMPFQAWLRHMRFILNVPQAEEQ